jgi:hypothetical protein
LIGFLAHTKIVITFVNGTRICEQIVTRSQGFIDSETVIPTLVSALQADDPCIRRCTAEALGRFGPDAGLYLERAIEDEPSDVQEVMKEANRRAEKYNALLRDATLHLEQAIGDEDSKVRTAVVEAVRNRRYQDSLARAFEEDEDREEKIERIAAADSDACLVCGQIIPEEARGCPRCGWTWEEVEE